jgi:hypothetical protein
MADQLRGFVSYSHEDEALFKELMKHLKAAKILEDFWSDQRITAGEEWDQAILTQLRNAQIILLLISVDFMASDYIETVEVKEAMARHTRGEVRVIPIILRPVEWTETPYHILQALPKRGKPVTKWTDRDEAFVDIIAGIRESIKQLENNQAQPVVAPKKHISIDNLHTALLSLDYREQARTFRQVIQNKAHIGAFLIHGEMECGQAWLLHRLLKNAVIENATRSPFKFQLTRTSAGRNLGRLWFSLGQWLNQKDPPMVPATIVEQVYALWQKQSMIFILTDIDGATKDYLQEFLSNFWEPLVEMINQRGQLQEPPNFYLLLFLVDNIGNVEGWDIHWKEQFDTPGSLVKLKRIQDFTSTDVEDWIENEMDRYGLPPTLKLQDILVEGGIPETVLYQIYKICGYELYEHESAW